MSNYSDLLIFASFFIFWILLNRWILPWFGISTCMSGGCAVNPRPTVRQQDAPTTSRTQLHEHGMNTVDRLNEASRVSETVNQG